MKPMLILLLTAVSLTALATESLDTCAVCRGRIGGTVYLFEDKVTGGKKAVCEKCSALTTVCYLCGLPVKEAGKQLPDGRILCARDVKRVVLDEAEAQRIWHEVKETVERQLSRFMTFPENVTVHPLDRADLQQMFKVVGNDFTCPNVWGCTLRKTNDDNRVTFKISLLRGLPPSVLRATCAHEFAHTWLNENLSRERERQISQDAEEGFCELIACLYCEARGDQAQIGVIKSNAYSRGQFALFREAERQFGMNDVVDWMKYGVDAQLNGDDLAGLRKVAMPRRVKEPPAVASVTMPPTSVAASRPPETLTLKGIMWSTRPSAVINDRTFRVNEEAKVRLGLSNVVVRCLAIRRDAVVVQVGGAPTPQTLTLRISVDALKR